MIAIHIGRPASVSSGARQTPPNRRGRCHRWKSPAGRQGFLLARRWHDQGKRRRRYGRSRRKTAPGRRPPAGSDGSSSAPRPRRASRSKTWFPARRWSCARAPAPGRHDAHHVRQVPRPRPGRGHEMTPRSRWSSRQTIAGRSGNRRAVWISSDARLAGRDQRSGSRIET